MILDGDIREHIGAKPAFFCPDGLGEGASSYILSHLKPQVVRSVEEFKSFSSILFSWTYSWQDVGWLQRVSQSVIVGGKHAELLAFCEKLPHFENVYWWLGRLEGRNTEPYILPDYSATLADNPLMKWLIVYSGDGCYWRKCKFCNTEYLPPYKQFNPEYVASVVALANKYGKVGDLSALSHTVPWLEEMESYLTGGRWYAAYARAGQENWHHLKKAHSIFIGLEYLSDSVLERVNKGITAQQIMDTIIEILSLGINVDSTIILDLWEHEEEREEHYQNVLRLFRATQRSRIGKGAGSFILRETIYKPVKDNLYILMDGEKMESA